MNYVMMSKGKRILYAVVASLLFLVTTGVVWYVNHIIPFMMDDNWYATLLYSDEKIKNLLDIFNAQKWHYMNWGGRSVTHTILQLVILSGELVADVLNTVMVVLTGIIITFMSETMTGIKRSFPERIMCTTIVMGIMIALAGNWELSMFWQSGACNYLYITVFVLLFIWVYMRELPYDCLGSREPLWGVNVWIIPLAIIAGWSNENIGPVTFVFAVATVFYVKKVGHNVETWMKEGIVFSLLGSLACIFAPGNFVRSQEIAKQSMWITIYERVYYEFKASFMTLVILVLLLIVAIALCKCVFYMPIGIEVRYVIAMAVLSWGAMTLSPHYPDRATYGTMILLILAIVAIWQKIFEKKYALRNYVYLCAGVLWLRGMYFLVTFVVYNVLGIMI